MIRFNSVRSTRRHHRRHVRTRARARARALAAAPPSRSWRGRRASSTPSPPRSTAPPASSGTSRARTTSTRSPADHLRARGLDVLVNNASSLGPVPLVPLADTECEDLEAALATNVVGPFRLTKALLGALAASARAARTSLVVNISSDAAETAIRSGAPDGRARRRCAPVAHLARRAVRSRHRRRRRRSRRHGHAASRRRRAGCRCSTLKRPGRPPSSSPTDRGRASGAVRGPRERSSAGLSGTR